MARECNDMNLPPVIAAYQQWINKCLIGDGSLFSTANLWTPELVEEVREAFIDHPDMGGDSFWEKLKKQMQNASQGAKHLMAEMIWVMLTFPSNINANTKRNGVREVWAYSGQVLAEDSNLLSDEVLAGIGSGGQGYLTGYWRELTFIIKLTVDLKKRDQGERQKLLTSYDDFVAWIGKLPEGDARQFRHMLRYVAFPDRVERIASNRHRQEILDRFGVATESETKNWGDRQLDEALVKLRTQLQEQYPGQVLDFYEPPLKAKWLTKTEPAETDQTKSWNFTKWMGPVLDALRALGGAANPKAVQQQVLETLRLPDTINDAKNKSGQSKFYNELHWARQYLVWEGLMESQTRGQWMLSEKGKHTFLDEEKAQQIAEKWVALNKQSNAEVGESIEVGALHLNDSAASTVSRQYWTLSAGEGGEMWDDFYSSGVAAIGWDDLGDLTQFKTKEEIRLKLLEIWPSDSSKKNDAHACWQFAHDIEVGDIIFAKQGFSRLLGYGVVESEYQFDESRNSYQHVHKVKWHSDGPVDLPGDSKMAMKTLTDITPYPDFVKLIASKVGLELEEDLTVPVKNSGSNGVGYWWLNANPKIWDFRKAPIGSSQTYTSYNKNGKKRRIYEHFQAVKPGDLMIGYVTTPDKEVVGLCEITKGLHTTDEGEVIEFKKIEQFPEPVTWAELQSVPELSQCEPLQNNQGSLFSLKESEFNAIRQLIDASEAVDVSAEPEKFTKAEALDGLFMAESEFDSMLALLKRKKALILQGPPGVGKTFVAKRIAYALMGQKDERRVAMVQFHPSYGYEDFVQGYRPTSKNGLERRDGVFYQFVRLARNNPEQDWFFIIDEINRGNLAKIFGELLMLLEADKRGPDHQISLTYSDKDEQFYLPENVHVIGTMNTADRSLAMVDYALRRRFAFMTLQPALATPAFESWMTQQGTTKPLVEKIRTRIKNLNDAIDDERDLGERFRVGHSFFCPRPGEIPNEAWYETVIRSEIKPLLEEYFDTTERVNSLVEDLLK